MEEVPSSSSHQKTKRNLSLNLSSNSLFTTCLLLRRCHRLQMETCQDKITLTVASMPHQASIPSSNKHNLVTVEQQINDKKRREEDEKKKREMEDKREEDRIRKEQ